MKLSSWMETQKKISQSAYGFARVSGQCDEEVNTTR
jgi:hypothetical protein